MPGPSNSRLVYEVRTTGSDANGGGFNSAASGTDYSQQDAAQITYTDLVIQTPNTRLRSVANPFTSAHVGNVINITGGTGFIQGRYLIESVTSGTAEIGVALGTAGSSGGAGKLGGALATLSTALPLWYYGGMTLWIKSGTYTVGTALSANINNGDGIARLIGYGSSRGDNGRATLQASAGSITMFGTSTATGTVITIENMVFDGNSRSTINAVRLNTRTALSNCIFKNFTDAYAVFFAGDSNQLYNCEVGPNAFTNTTDGTVGAILVANTISGVGDGAHAIDCCYIHDNAFSGSITTGAIVSNANTSHIGGVSIRNNIIYNNTGTNIHGVLINRYVGAISGNAIHANSKSGIYFDSGTNNAYGGVVYNNIITNNGAYGMDASGTIAALNNNALIHHNAYYGNTSGAYHNITAGVGEVTLSGLPYVSAPTDFSLNATSGQGLSCRGAGVPGAIGLSSVVGMGYADIGPLQHSTPPPTTAYTFAA